MAIAEGCAADGIRAAAESGDREKTLDVLAVTLETCVGCHAVHRQQIVDRETWST